MANAIPQRIFASDSEVGDAIFATLAFLNCAAEMMCEKLVAVADSENRQSGPKEVWINIGTAALVNASRAAGDDDAFTRAKFACRRVAWLNVGINSQLADAPGDQVGVLSTGIEDGDLRFS